MVAVWGTVRVFISSTFRDMHAEPDYPVKVVLPKLRERLAGNLIPNGIFILTKNVYIISKCIEKL